jgi:hypothetical protein
MTIAPDPLEAELGEELRRRLTDLAATTIVDPDGRDEIERRLGAPRPTPWRRAGLVAAPLLLAPPARRPARPDPVAPRCRPVNRPPGWCRSPRPYHRRRRRPSRGPRPTASCRP